MLSLLTDYFFQYGRVSIPGVGSFEQVREPARLDMAAQVIHPPGLRIVQRADDAVSAHQLQAMGVDEGSLAVFGKGLRSKLEEAPFHWKGIGVLEARGSALVLEGEAIGTYSLSPVPAQRVLRQDAEHSMLVGDMHRTNTEMAEVLNRPADRRPLYLVAGWVLLILALVAIIVLLYMGKLNPAASGTRWPLSF